MSKTGYEQRELIKFNFESLDLDKNEFFGSSPPSVFVGRIGYPQVNVGVLSPVKTMKEAYLLDSPKEWAKLGLKDIDILKLRSQLVNSRFKARIKSFDSRFMELSQEIGMAYKPVEIEVELKNKPVKKIKMNDIVSPLGNNANVKDIRMTENPKIKNVVEKTVSDIDMKANEGLKKLYRKGIDENFLTKLLSIGLLGVKKNRKLVPTRWSITATDDILGKEMLKEIRDYQEIDFQAYFDGYLGNYYLVLFFPGVWGFELYEMQVPLKVNPWSKTGKFYAYDYEGFDGRKNYAEETAGGYYACRLGIIEKLRELRRQGYVLVFRFITEEDKYPLGVWVCREATRISLKNKINIDFDSSESLLNFAKAFALKKFKVDISNLIEQSRFYEINKQKKLFEFVQ